MNTGSFIIQNKTNNNKLFIKIFIYAMHNYVITNNITLFIVYRIFCEKTIDARTVTQSVIYMLHM